MRKRFIKIPERWIKKLLLKYCIPQGYHLHKNPVGSGRKKKEEVKDES